MVAVPIRSFNKWQDYCGRSHVIAVFILLHNCTWF